MYRALRPLLFQLPPEPAHHLGLGALELLGQAPRLCARSRAQALSPLRSAGVDLGTRLARLPLPHPVLLAAGLDKDAEAIAGLFALGFAAVEVGTLTPRAQPGNPTPRVFRIPEHQALINRMGFNNRGAAEAAARLRETTFRPGPVGVNLGKNKDTPLERAVDDYLAGVDALGALADYVVVNASSPNTPGLRSLQEPEQLQRLLRAVRERLDEVHPGCPLLLKIAPDLGPEAVDAIVDVARACRLDGLVATNTTLTRPFAHPHAAQAGGLSGAPVRAMSTAVVARAWLRARGELPIIGVGGVFTGDDAYEKLRAGACAIQLYTGFIYEGPRAVTSVLQGLVRRMKADGIARLADVIGQDAATHAARWS